MIKLGSEEAVWFDYVTKLHDRDIEKRRNSGFTTWAVLGLVSILLYKVLNRTELFDTIPRFVDLMAVTLPAVLNLLFAFLILFLSLIISSESGEEVRLMTKLDRISRPLLYIPVFVAVIAVTSLNFYAAIAQFGYEQLRWPYYVFGSYYALNVFSPILKKLKAMVKAKRDYADIPLLKSSAIFAYSPLNLILRIVLLLIGLGFLFCALFMLNFLFKTFPLNNLIQAIKTSLELIALIALLFFLLGHFSNRMKIRFLETLERRIITEELTAEEIRTIFAKQYLGETIRDWVLQVEAKLKELSDKSLKAIKEAENDLQNLTAIDSKYVYEIEGRKKSICKKAHDSVKEYLTYMGKLLKHTEHLINEQAFLSETDTITRITSSWKEQHKAVKTNLEAMCKTCRAVLDNNHDSKSECDNMKAEQVATADRGPLGRSG